MKKKKMMNIIINFMAIICGVLMKPGKDTVMICADEHGPTEVFFAGSLGENSSTIIIILLVIIWLIVALVIFRKIRKNKFDNF